MKHDILCRILVVVKILVPSFFLTLVRRPWFVKQYLEDMHLISYHIIYKINLDIIFCGTLFIQIWRIKSFSSEWIKNIVSSDVTRKFIGKNILTIGKFKSIRKLGISYILIKYSWCYRELVFSTSTKLFDCQYSTTNTAIA